VIRLFNLIIIGCLCYGANLAWADSLSYSVQGVSGDILTNIDNRLKASLAQLGDQPSAAEITQWYRQAPEQIQTAMQPFGYFRARISPQLTQTRDSKWQALFIVHPGARLPVRYVTIELQGQGQFDAALREWKQDFPLRPGEPLVTKAYQQAKRQFFRITDREGYLAAKFTTAEIRIDRLEYYADIILIADTGPRHYYGSLNFNQTPFSEKFLRRFAQFRAGETYDSTQVQTLQKRLVNSGYFKQVQVEPQIQDDQTYVPIDVTLLPAKSQTITVGGGYSTDTGIRGTAGWDIHRVNKNGHQLQTLLQASEIENNLQMEYKIPGKDPLNDKYTFGGTIYTYDIPSVKSRAAQFTAASTRIRDPWQQTLSLNSLYERYTRHADNTKNERFILYPRANWQVTKADELLFPKQGYRGIFTVLGASKSALSDTDFVQFVAEGKYITSISDTTRLLFRGTGGYTFVNNVDNLPPTLQFFTGGAQSVRGYTYQSLGPGKILVIGSAEIQQEIIPKWHLAVFYDVGNAFNNRPATLRNSWGIGIVRETPVGPLRASIAQRLDGNTGRNSLRFVFSMGPDL
jgi:translocation and assembly module TamA